MTNSLMEQFLTMCLNQASQAQSVEQVNTFQDTAFGAIMYSCMLLEQSNEELPPEFCELNNFFKENLLAEWQNWYVPLFSAIKECVKEQER